MMRLLSIPSIPNASKDPAAVPRLARTRKTPERVFVRVAVLLGSWGILIPWAQGQEGFHSGKWELLRNQQEYDNFKQAQKQAEQSRSLARARIPGYNLALSEESRVFQRHMSDMHQRQVSCRLCREHVKRIRNLSRQIERAMK